MSKLRSLLFILLVFTGMTSCKHKSKTGTDVDYGAQGYIAATVINYEVDGCQWMIQLENGTKYEPQNMDESFRKDQQKVWIKYVEVKGAMTICMAGKVIKLTDIKQRH